MVAAAELPALQTGAADTGLDHETPGPDTVQVAFCPVTPVAAQVIVLVCPVRTRFGLAVITRSGVVAVHQFVAAVTSGHWAVAVPLADTDMLYVPPVESVRVTVLALPYPAPSAPSQLYGALAPSEGVAV